MQVLSVGQFNTLMNEVFTNMEEFQVEGEITQLKFSQRNSAFIELKDPKDKALLRVSNYAPWIEGINSVSEGMQVVVYGRPEIYSPMGSFSFKVRKIAPQGEGSLKAAFDNLKKALEGEGLFSEDRKRSLPPVVTRIALITADQSAALADFCKIMEENQSAVEVEFFPVHVQGTLAEKEVVEALQHNAKRDDIDAIVMVRGGGSLEDLASFNSELVARAVFSSEVPVIVGVGHEVDVSIADLVADVRASTPSQAAYYLVSQNNHFLDLAEQRIQYMEQQTGSLVPSSEAINEKVRFLEQKLRYVMPSLDEINRKKSLLDYGLNAVRGQIESYKRQILQVGNLDQRISELLRIYSLQTQNNLSLLSAYNPHHVLKRGYALVEKDGKYLSSVSQAKAGDQISLKLKDGSIDTKIEKIIKN